MSITSKLFAMLGLTQAAREEIQREINIYEAIEAHIAWKIRLNDYLEGRSKEVLQPHHICVDNRCVLGRWIHGPGKVRFGDVVLFRKMTEEHAKFHFHASRVVDAHQAGNTVLAKEILSDDFAKQSRKTVDCLTMLHIQIFGNEVA